MNKAILVGRLTKDPELKSTASGVSICSFSIAVNRRFKNADGNYDADFINCVAWRQQADFLARHFSKGRMVGVVGSIQTRNFETKDKQKIYVTEIAVDEIHFVDAKKMDAVQRSQCIDDDPFTQMEKMDKLSDGLFVPPYGFLPGDN